MSTPAAAVDGPVAAPPLRSRPVPSLGIDRLKGVLLLFVIFGHTYSQTVPNSFTKLLIYGFHMPAFLFVSGYLIDFARQTRRTPAKFVTHYWRRMLWQWALVSVIWAQTLGTISWDRHDLLHEFVLYPMFHLWYVPMLMATLTITYACARWLGPVGPTVLVILAAAGAVLWVYAEVGPHDLGLDNRYYGYPIWFVLGVAARNRWFRVPVPVPVAVVLLLGGLAIYSQALHGHQLKYAVGLIVLNLGLTSLLPWVGEQLQRVHIPHDPLRLVGAYSLWIYLLHPFAAQEFALHVRTVWQQRVGGAVLTAMVVVVSVAIITLGRRLRSMRTPAHTPGHAR